MSCHHYDHAAYLPRDFGCEKCLQERETRYGTALRKIVARCAAFDDGDLAELVQDLVKIAKDAIG